MLCFDDVPMICYAGNHLEELCSAEHALRVRYENVFASDVLRIYTDDDDDRV